MTPTPDTSRKLSDVDRDPRLFTWFLTLVMVFLYIIALLENPVLHKPLPLISFTVVLVVHIMLHWQIEKVIESKKLTIGYFLLQGALAFIICSIARNQGVLLGIYMALLGETVGMLRFSRGALMAILYYAILAIINYQQFDSRLHHLAADRHPPCNDLHPHLCSSLHPSSRCPHRSTGTRRGTGSRQSAAQ